MSNRPKPGSTKAKKVQKMAQGYEERIERQKQIIDDLQGRLKEGHGAMIITAVLISKQASLPITVTQNELTEVDITKVRIVEGHDKSLAIYWDGEKA